MSDSRITNLLNENVTVSAKSSLILGENKAAFRRVGHLITCLAFCLFCLYLTIFNIDDSIINLSYRIPYPQHLLRYRIQFRCMLGYTKNGNALPICKPMINNVIKKRRKFLEYYFWHVQYNSIKDIQAIDTF